jgi:hypothetical protein
MTPAIGRGSFFAPVSEWRWSKMKKFVHRDNRDGTLDSVCSRCFATVAIAKHEADLEAAEKYRALQSDSTEEPC